MSPTIELPWFDEGAAIEHSMKRYDFSRILFYAVSSAALLGISFAFGLYSGAKQTVVYETVRALKTAVKQAFQTTSEEASTLTKTHPKHFLQPSRYDGTGVTINDASEDRALILMSGFFGDANELRLIRRNGALVARWPLKFHEIFPEPDHLQQPPATDWNVDTHGALALPDGSVVFNFEGSGLVKLDRCGGVVWTLARESHHSVERAAGGGFWVPGQRHFSEDSNSPFPPFKTPFREHTIMRVSEDGRVLTEISVPQLFYDNGLEAVLTATGHSFEANMIWDGQILHLNKVAEVKSAVARDFPMFEAGDLALSIRELNLLMIIDPHTSKIKWWRVGPWLRQHDPEFKPGGTLVVFNNNNYGLTHNADPELSGAPIPRASNIMEVNPASNELRIIYGSGNEQEMLSVIRGKLELTPGGGLLITEFEGGRVFETDAAGRVIWEYINRYSSDEVAEITEARLYPASYFSVSDWSCDM
jgi:hypothetical protein